MQQLTLGSLFDGIGGFGLAASKVGIKPVWAAEVDPSCIAVTKNRFPDMEHLGSVTDINGADITPVDIISFGSPCQDLSVAGKMAGLDGKRSGLFREAVRIIYEMREKTNGMYPAFIVWENVPGAFISNNGRDFQTVLQEISKTDIPMPPSGKWARAGVVRGGGICICWRQLDAQYWGVPQRRKRIFLVGSFGNESSREILFKPESVRGYLVPGGEEKKETAGATRRSVESGCKCFDGRGNGNGNIAPTIVGDHNNCIGDYAAVVLQAMCLNDQGGDSISAETKELSPTLRSQTHGNLPIVCYSVGADLYNGTLTGDKSATITAAQSVKNATGATVSDGVFGTLRESGGQCGGGSESIVTQKSVKWIVRRLTPLECERLQGYPDGWTVLPKIGNMSDDEYSFWLRVFMLDMKIRSKQCKLPPSKAKIIKWYNKLDSDVARYRQLGNSLAIPYAVRILGGIQEYEER